jgi:hypothetical protein
MWIIFTPSILPNPCCFPIHPNLYRHFFKPTEPNLHCLYILGFVVSTGAWLTYEGPHPQRKLTLSQPPWIAHGSSVWVGLHVLLHLHSMMELGWLKLAYILCALSWLQWVHVSNALLCPENSTTFGSNSLSAVSFTVIPEAGRRVVA